jgi:hypothetical protein
MKAKRQTEAVLNSVTMLDGFGGHVSVIRVGGPNIDNACVKLLHNDACWFPDFPDARASVGGKFANFVFCRNEHLTALTKSYLQELASDAGFTDIHFCAPVRETVYFDEDVLRIEYEDDQEYPHSILIEARKPGPAGETSQ